MKVLELFAGTRSVSKAFEQRGHETYSVDWDEQFDVTLHADISKLTAKDIVDLCGGVPDVWWNSFDCTSYSTMAISHHRERESDGTLTPKSEYAKFCDMTNSHVIDLIKELKPKLYFIENPVGALRKMAFMKDIPRYTVAYCQYGDFRQKPTDIWTNHPNPDFKPMCKRGAPCHMSAPRGSKSGTQLIKGARDRARLPDLLCQHIVDISEDYIGKIDD